VNLLALVQSLHNEGRQPGSAPTAVAAQTGRAADLVRWTIEAYNDIQRELDGKWKWLYKEWHVDTVASTPSYATGAITDTAAAAVIDRFRAWDYDEDLPWFIYLSSAGVATENELGMEDWPEFRSLYVKGTHTAGFPGLVAIDPKDDKIYLGPTPDAVYRVGGNYWKSNQALAADADIPEMPSDYHMMIVYRAMVKYAYNAVAPDILARATTDGSALYDALVNNQWMGRARMRYPATLA